MLELNKEEKQTLEKVIKYSMENVKLFRGEYDAKNGKESFMHGICVLLEYLSGLVDDDFYNKVEKTFTRNMVKSKEKALTNRK